MKVGYPDTINSSAYKQVSPLKARYTSSGEGEDLKAVELEPGSLAKKAKKEDPPNNYNDTPINMITPLKAREMSAKRRARRGERVERIDAKANSIAEQAYLKGVADEDLPTTAKKGKQKKYDRLTKKSDRISAKTTKILRDNNQIPSAKKGFEKKDYGGKDDKFDPKTMKPPTLKKKSPVKNIDIVAKNRADRKAAAEKAKKAEDAIRQSQSSSKPTATTTKKKSILAKRKERRAERNPKVEARQEGKAARKEQRQTRRDDVKDQKSQVTKARNTRKTARITKEDNRKKGNVQAKVQSKLTRINEKTAKIKEDKTETVQASKDKKAKQLKGSIGFSRKSIGLKTNEQRAKERANRT